MHVVPWNPDLHLPTVEGWFDARSIPIRRGRADFWPATGFMVEDVLVGFLFLTDAPAVAYVDGFVGNPERGHEEVRAAAREIVERLRQAAHERGVEVLAAYTNKRSLIAAGQDAGFTVDDRRDIAFLHAPACGAKKTRRGTR